MTKASFLADHRRRFHNALPASRLGKEHESLQAFQNTVKFSPSSAKEYSLVVVTDSSKQKILLGLKHRGFGKGMYNSFGGKVSTLECSRTQVLMSVDTRLINHKKFRSSKERMMYKVPVASSRKKLESRYN